MCWWLKEKGSYKASFTEKGWNAGWEKVDEKRKKGLLWQFPPDKPSHENCITAHFLTSGLNCPQTFLRHVNGCAPSSCNRMCSLSSSPAGLGVPVWERPPLGWVLSPVGNSRLILGLGWYSLLGCDEACLILYQKGKRGGWLYNQLRSKKKIKPRKCLSHSLI